MQEELMHQAINQTTELNNLDLRYIKEICKIFNIDPNAEPQTLSTKIKTKIADICLTQRQSYRDYFSLPRFQIFSEDIKNMLLKIFHIVWHRFQQLKKKLENNYQAEAERLFPPLRTLKQFEDFHLGLFTMYKESHLCPQMYMNYHPMMMNYLNPLNPANYPGMFPPNFSMVGNNDFMGMQYNRPPMNFPPGFMSRSNQLSKDMYKQAYPHQQTSGKAMEQIVKGSQIAPQHSHPAQINQQISQNQKYSHESFKKLFIKEKGQKKVNLPQQVMNDDDDDDQQFDTKKCLCKGQIKNKETFQCQSCGFCFHYNCLMIQVIKKQLKCPNCSLKEKTIFTQVLETIQSDFMLFEGENSTWSGTIPEDKKTEVIKTMNIEIQIKFIRLNANKKLQEFEKINKTIDRIRLSPQQLKKIPGSVDLEFVIKGSTSNQVNLFFFGVYIVKLIHPKEAFKQIYNSDNQTNSSFIEQFLKQEGMQVYIDATDPISKKIIKFPARGRTCKHTAVFDLKVLLNDQFDKGQDPPFCPICHKKMYQLTCDKYLQQVIKKKRQTGKMQTTFQIHSLDKVDWIGRVIQQTESKSSDQIEDDIDDQMESEEQKIDQMAD